MSETSQRPTVLLAATVFVGSSLLFLVQPLLGAYILPWFGGSPAVWTTCMLFFQVMLVAGYGYAFLLSRHPPRTQAAVHVGLLVLSVALLPIAPDPSWAPGPDSLPASRILALLTVSVGVPYLVLSANSTLLQSWAAALSPRSPYKLYAWSNVGSMLALLSYPLLVEPLAGAATQARLWSYAYLGFTGLAGLSAWRMYRANPELDTHTPPAPLPPAGTRALWIVLPAVGSALLLATTHALTDDVGVVPFFWVMPLALYLLTYVIAFATEGIGRPSRSAAAMAIGVLALLPVESWPGMPLSSRQGVGCAGLFLVCLALHLELVRRAPPRAHLTRFYFYLSLGGALGGLSVALVAPLVLVGRADLLVLLVTAPAVLAFAVPRSWPVPVLALGATVFVAYRYADAYEVISRTRSFYGHLRVERRLGDVQHLVDGRVSHGFQYLDDPRTPTGYYDARGGAGRVFLPIQSPRRVGLVGLGVGTLATYGRKGDVFRFYELNPDVVEIARRDFTFLADSAAQIEVVVGDARIRLAAEPPQGFDLLVLDAFTGDAVPVHLLTREAFQLWKRHLAPDAILAAHVSNHHLELALLVAGQAHDAGLASAWLQVDMPTRLGRMRSQWVFMASPERLNEVGLPAGATSAEDEDKVAPLWTDDHTPLWPLLR